MSETPEGIEVYYGGPFTYESEAIDAELHKAHLEGREADLWGLFKGKAISTGAVALIEKHLHPVKNEGFRASGENVVPPSEGYVYPVDGGVNTIDDESPVIPA